MIISLTSPTMTSALGKNSSKKKKNRITHILLKFILCGIVINSIFSFLLTNEVGKGYSVIEKDEIDTNIDSSHSTNQSIEKQLLTNEVRKRDTVIEKDEMDTNIDSSHSTNQSIEKQESQLEKPKIKTPLVVAYAFSLVKCGDHQNHIAGLIGAALVLLHSIHKISSRNPLSGSKYDYKMYAIVHSKAQVCADVLKKVGFEIIIVDPPVETKEIKGKFLRENIHKERCCGHDEFIKLYAYTLPEEIIVHTDLDFTFFKPMDHLFDAIHFSKDSPEGKTARNIIELERPGEELPDKIGAFLTRDWTQTARGNWPPGFQAGFLVARRDPSVINDLVKIIKEGNYSEGWGKTSGWGSKIALKYYS